MTKIEFTESMSANAVRTDAYAFGDSSQTECYVVQEVDCEWLVYYSERGMAASIAKFSSEEDALSYLNDIVLKDRSTRRVGG